LLTVANGKESIPQEDEGKTWQQINDEKIYRVSLPGNGNVTNSLPTY
jgi:hypothetical protein